MVIFHFISESSLIVRELNSINAKLHKYTGLFPSRLDDRIIELVGIPFRYLEWEIKNRRWGELTVSKTPFAATIRSEITNETTITNVGTLDKLSRRWNTTTDRAY